MKKNRWLRRGAALLLIAVVLAATISATAIGTAEDPLVSLSYLQKTFLGQVMADVTAVLDQRDAELTADLDEKIAAAAANQVTMSKGQQLIGDIGCEVMLRVGTAVCVSASKTGLIDQSDAIVLEDGDELVKNHLYMMTIEERGVKATANTVKVLVRGTYTLK